MQRRDFIRNTGVLGSGLLLFQMNAFAATGQEFPVVRIAEGERRFRSSSVEKAIADFTANVKNGELAWLFNNCFPNTLDTTVFHEMKNGVPDTYVITGDIDAMWLRDSSAQVWPYLQFVNQDEALKALVAGVINRQTACVLKDPYANAFYNDPQKKGEWATDHTAMKPGVHERKWEIDSLCYPIRLAYRYWKQTGDTKPFTGEWKGAVMATLQTFKEQQRKNGNGPYRFQRTTQFATDTLPMSGYGFPVKPVGLICSAFRPSDDATTYSFLIPSNFFAVTSLRQAAEMVTAIVKDQALANQLTSLAAEVEKALKEHAIVNHPT
ncbi:MAG: glycoside hydrolase family 125 protein, partial [Bacteroidota bacterium]|nr:glycoside hydrolase family 125 protein [Bacteroidota bacterium]